jgi:ADP-heptose:LPS heptosyltransferase
LKKILIIKHGSLGDIVFALPAIYSIQQHFFNENIDLLTDKKYCNFLKLSGYFDKIIEDNRSSNIILIMRLLYNIILNKYDFIIDLQNSTRTSYYNFIFRLLSKSTISSSRKFSHYRYLIPKQGAETTTQGLFNQIALININKSKNVNYHWLNTKLDKIYNQKIVLFIPGVSSGGKYKQWDPYKFAKLAKYCEEKKYKICVIGTSFDKDSIIPMINLCNNLINNIDISPPNIIFSIARKSKLVVTNDTGPGHIAALSGVNMLWIINDNDISKANIGNNSNNFKITSKFIKDISTQDAFNIIEKNKLL